MSRDDSSVAVMGLKVLGSPKVASTSRPPGMPGSQGAINGCSGRGMLLDADEPDEGDSFLPQPQRIAVARTIATGRPLKNFIAKSIHAEGRRGKRRPRR